MSKYSSDLSEKEARTSCIKLLIVLSLILFCISFLVNSNLFVEKPGGGPVTVSFRNFSDTILIKDGEVAKFVLPPNLDKKHIKVTTNGTALLMFGNCKHTFIDQVEFIGSISDGLFSDEIPIGDLKECKIRKPSSSL